MSTWSDLPDQKRAVRKGPEKSCVPFFEVRPYRASDRPAIREICVATAWMGQPAGDRIADDWIWAEYWTRYFTDRERRHTWVAVSRVDGRVVGYLTGTADVRRFERYVPWLLPGMVLRVIRGRLISNPVSRRAIFGTLKSMMRGELALPPGIIERYPATLHLNLLAETRGQGLGRRLFERYIARIRRLGVRGVHAQTLSVNAGVAKFNEALGFRQVATRPFTAYAHVDPQPISVHTWVLPL